jgi:hypothetical protein
MASSKPKTVLADKGIEIVPNMTCCSLLSEGLPSLTLGFSSEKESKGKEASTDNWGSVFDPNTGRTYYYHRDTRVTTWTKPNGFGERDKRKQALGRTCVL